MSVELRWDQCCETVGCKKPRHIGSLCAACFYGATPVRRATELLADTGPDGRVSAAGRAWLDEVWAAEEERQPTEPIPAPEIALCVELEAILDLPAVEPKRWAA